MSAWQPIETAPRNMAKFLAFSGQFIEVCLFLEDVLVLAWNHEAFSGYDGIVWDATHWMPLPAPPEASQ